jgi:hypothetical protein
MRNHAWPNLLCILPRCTGLLHWETPSVVSAAPALPASQSAAYFHLAITPQTRYCLQQDCQEMQRPLFAPPDLAILIKTLLVPEPLYQPHAHLRYESCASVPFSVISANANAALLCKSTLSDHARVDRALSGSPWKKSVSARSGQKLAI